MIITFSDASNTALTGISLLLDYSVRYWRVLGRPLPPAWSRITADSQGPFQISEGGKTATLFEKVGFSGRQPLMTLETPPLSSMDAVRRQGSGALAEPKDPALKGTKFKWQAGATVDGALAGNSIRADAIALIERHLPHTPGTFIDPPNWVEGASHGENTKKNAQGFRSTGCGGLPGKMFKELQAMGWPIPNDTVDGTNPKYTGKKRDPKEKAQWMALAGSSTGYKYIVMDGIEKRLGTPGEIYVRYKKGDPRRPQPGDVYVLDIKGTAMFRHVGVIVDASTDEWVTADGGQDGPLKSGFAVGLNLRSFDPRTGLVGGKGEKGDLDGWIDIEALVRG